MARNRKPNPQTNQQGAPNNEKQPVAGDVEFIQTPEPQEQAPGAPGQGQTGEEKVHDINERRPAPPLTPNNVTAQGVRYMVHQAIIPMAVSYEDALNPEFWASCTNKVNVFDEIRLLAEDGSWMRKVFVAEKRPHYLRVVPIEGYGVDLDTPRKQDDVIGGIRVDYRGVKRGHCVIRESDGTYLADNLSSRSAAYIERERYLQQIASEHAAMSARREA